MITEPVHVQSLTESESERLAAQFQTTPGHQWAVTSGMSSRVALTCGWSTWLKAASPDVCFLLSIGARAAVLLRFEHDEFNSECAGIAQARLHWLFNPTVTWTVEQVAKFASELRALLKASAAQLTALRLLGHPTAALQLFQMAGFRLILGNAWFYRQPGLPPPDYALPPGVELQFRDLRLHPLQDDEYAEAMAMADDSIFPDRFSKDIHFDAHIARRRFRVIAGNALSGKIADYAVLARVESKPQALIFFGMGERPAADGYPVAGKWLTTLTSPSLYNRGVSFSLVAEAMRALPEGKAHWTAACALDHFASIRVAQKLGFRIGAVAYDMHYWRDE
jgi:RimJ/RimL family protein N-acetyltransferase